MRRFDGQRWEEYVTKFVCPDFQRFGDVVRARILPVFDDIKQEADELAKRHYKEMMSSLVAYEDADDGGAISELALDAGDEHYDMLSSMRSATLNLFSAALYHLTEQHMVDLWLMVLDYHQREEVSAQDATAWFKEKVGLDVKVLTSWPLVHELRLVANVVKHAEGHSAEDLRKLRPELFQLPQLKAAGLGMSPARVRKPLFGQDVYITADDFAKYHKGSVAFWTELAERLPDCDWVGGTK